MLNLNSSTLAAVVEKAAHDAAQHPRWLTAIGRAILELDSNPFIERNDHGGLIIGSTSGEVYSANGVCQCKAFEFKLPCWHRAAARLVRLHDEQQAASAALLIDQPGTPIGIASYGEMPEIVLPPTLAERRAAAQRATALLNECFA